MLPSRPALLLLGLLSILVAPLDGQTQLARKLSRKRRYVVFPEGSSFSVAVCMTVGIAGNPNQSLMSESVNWGIAYNLPNETYEATVRREEEEKKGETPESVMKRRHRRELYHHIEVAMNDMGFNGRECILRALCESPQYFGRRGATMVEELLRTIFSLPRSKVLPFEHPDLPIYDSAHREGYTSHYCPSLYPACGFSLHDLALGRYSAPLNAFM